MLHLQFWTEPPKSRRPPPLQSISISTLLSPTASSWPALLLELSVAQSNLLRAWASWASSQQSKQRKSEDQRMVRDTLKEAPPACPSTTDWQRSFCNQSSTALTDWERRPSSQAHNATSIKLQNKEPKKCFRTLYLAAPIPIKSASRPPQPQHYSKNPELHLLLLLLILFSPSAFPPEQRLRETTQSSGNWQLQRIHESERERERACFWTRFFVEVFPPHFTLEALETITWFREAVASSSWWRKRKQKHASDRIAKEKQRQTTIV